MRLRDRRGQLLANVMVMLVVAAIIAAALMRLVLMRLTVADKMVGGGQGRAAAQAGYQLLFDDWATKGTCHDPGGTGGFSCPGGTANTCGCTCTAVIAGSSVTVTTAGTASNCAITTLAQ